MRISDWFWTVFKSLGVLIAVFVVGFAIIVSASLGPGEVVNDFTQNGRLFCGFAGVLFMLILWRAVLYGYWYPRLSTNKSEEEQRAAAVFAQKFPEENPRKRCLVMFFGHNIAFFIGLVAAILLAIAFIQTQ